MEEDIIKIYEEYSEQILFCKYYIAERLKHNAEMGRCGENILIQELKARFNMLEFVSGFVVSDGNQSPQCDIIVCRKNMYGRKIGDLYIVNPKDCLLIIEVKGNLTLTDIDETLKKNEYFKQYNSTSHIELALFAYRTRIGKKALLSNFGYTYNRIIKSYEQTELVEEKLIDIFVCLDRKNLNNSESRDKQLFFIKDKQNEKMYVKDSSYPVLYSFMNYIQSLQA